MECRFGHLLADVQGNVATKTASVGADSPTANVSHACLCLSCVQSAQQIIPHDVIITKIFSDMVLSE